MIRYGRETEKALAVLGFGRTPRPLIRAYAEVKLAAIEGRQATSNPYPEDYFQTLTGVCQEIIRGDHDEQFPLPLAQGGAGTSLHMNICEVIASLANESCSSYAADPLEDLALYQSTNDTFPTALILMSYRFLEEIEEKVVRLQEELTLRETAYQDWLLCGRTEMQDALPMTLGQLFSAWAGPVERDRWRLHKLKERLRQIPLGGTAVGTGYSAPRNYVFAAEKALRRITGLPLCRSQNLCDQVAHADSLAECASGLALCADNLTKWTGDLLLYSSSFLNEIPQEEQQYGSTIMPHKSNPVLIELIRGLSLEARSAGDLVQRYCREGQLQLNAYLPFAAEQMIRLHGVLYKALETASEKLIPALRPDRRRMERNLLTSPALVNTFRSRLGYKGVKELLPLIREENPGTIDELADLLKKITDLAAEEIEDHLDLHHLTTGGGK